jgi:hypothetical protein
MNALIQKIEENKKENCQYSNNEDKEYKIGHVHGGSINSP